MKYLTVVYAIPDDMNVAHITGNKHMTACSWCHAIDLKNNMLEALNITSANIGSLTAVGKCNTFDAWKDVVDYAIRRATA